MCALKLLDEEPSGLSLTLQQIIEQTITDENVRRIIGHMRASLVVRETSSDVATTIIVDNGDVTLQNGGIERPTATVAGEFETVAAISSGELGPVTAVLTRRIRVRGNLFKLLTLSKLIVLPAAAGSSRPVLLYWVIGASLVAALAVAAFFVLR